MNMLTTFIGGLLLFVSMLSGIAAFIPGFEAHSALLLSIAVFSAFGIWATYRISVRQRRAIAAQKERTETELMAQLLRLSRRPRFSINVTTRSHTLYAIAGVTLFASALLIDGLALWETLLISGLLILALFILTTSVPSLFRPALRLTERGIETSHSRLIPWGAIREVSTRRQPRRQLEREPSVFLEMRTSLKPQAVFHAWSIFRFSRYRHGISVVSVPLKNASVPDFVIANVTEVLWREHSMKNEARGDSPPPEGPSPMPDRP